MKVADVVDLGCEAAKPTPGGHDWPWVKQALYRYLRGLGAGGEARNLKDIEKLLDIAGAATKGECYLGIMALGFFAMHFMEPDERKNFIQTSPFGGVTFKRAIPLSYWDVYVSGWPIFGLLAAAASVVQRDPRAQGVDEVRQGLTGIDLRPRECCDFPGGDPNENDQLFLLALSQSLGQGQTERVGDGLAMPPKVPLEYLAQSAFRSCSWGRATAYFALAEGLLPAGKDSPLLNSSKTLMSLGEHNLDGCEPNLTVYHQMHSMWPFWQVLGRLEQKRFSFPVTPMEPAGPGAEAAERALPVLPAAVRLKWRHLLNKRSLPVVGQQVRSIVDHQHEQQPVPSDQSSCLEYSADLVYVALSADLAQIDGLIVTLHSGTVNAGASAMQLCFHVFVLPQHRNFVVDALRCAFGSAFEILESAGGSVTPTVFRLLGSSRLLLHSLNSTRVWSELGLLSDDGKRSLMASGQKDGVDVGALNSDTGNLGAVHNFARFLLHVFLPSLPRVVYLDVDIVVKGNLAELYHMPTSLGGAGTIAAVRRTHQNLRTYVDVLQPAVPTWLPSEALSFNAGVMVVDLLRWRERRASDLIAEWIALNIKRRLWLHGTQPPLLLLFHDEIIPLDWTWNVDGLGHRLNYPKDVLRNANILHWTGPLKPWRHHGVNRKLWEPYTLEYCPDYSVREHTTTCRPDSWFC